MTKSQKRWLAEAAGWYGAAAIMCAYGLVSFGLINAESYVFQLLNLTGALGILVIVIVDKVTQSIILNIFWAAIAAVTIFRMAVGS